MSGGHFGSTFQTYDLQPQAKCKNQMYVSMKRMSKVGEKHCTSQTSLFSVCGWCQFILSPCSGWPSQHIQNCAFQASNQCARSKSRRDLGTCESVRGKGGPGSPTKPGHGIFGGLGVKSKLCPVCSLGSNLKSEKNALTSTKSSCAKP